MLPGFAGPVINCENYWMMERSSALCVRLIVAGQIHNIGFVIFFFEVGDAFRC